MMKLEGKQIEKLQKALLCFLAWLVIVLIPNETLAQEPPATAVELQLAIDRTTLEVGELNQAILTLRNTTPYTLTNLSAELQGSTFSVTDSIELPASLAPQSSAQASYTLQSQTVGLQNAIFAVQYSWYEPNTGATQQWIETVSVEKISVTEDAFFDWPGYLIALVLGFALGKIATFFIYFSKEREEAQQQEEQAIGIMLAILHAARKGLQEEEEVSFGLWEDAIVKGNLYPSLHQFGRKIGEPELSKRLAELSITLHDYNQRLAKRNLPSALVPKLLNEVTALINILERQR